MNKQEIINLLNSNEGFHTGSVRTADNSVQLDKWKLGQNEYLITTKKLRNDFCLKNNPDYSENDRVQLLTLIS